MPIVKKKDTHLLEKLEYIQSAMADHDLTEDLIEQICAYIRQGVPNKIVAQAVGISYGVFMKWQRIGSGKEVTKDTNITLYKLLVKKISQAEALAKIDYIMMLKKAAEGGHIILEKEIHKKDGSMSVEKKLSAPSWMAASWYLERRDSQHFGKRAVVETTTEDQEEQLDNAILALLNKEEIPLDQSSSVAMKELDFLN